MIRYFLTVIALICVFTWVAMLPVKSDQTPKADSKKVQLAQNVACCDIGFPPPR